MYLEKSVNSELIQVRPSKTVLFGIHGKPRKLPIDQDLKI